MKIASSQFARCLQPPRQWSSFQNLGNTKSDKKIPKSLLLDYIIGLLAIRHEIWAPRVLFYYGGLAKLASIVRYGSVISLYKESLYSKSRVQGRFIWTAFRIYALLNIYNTEAAVEALLMNSIISVWKEAPGGKLLSRYFFRWKTNTYIKWKFL